MTWQWRRQGRIPLVNIVAGKNSSNRGTFCKMDNITAPRIKRDTLQKDLCTLQKDGQKTVTPSRCCCWVLRLLATLRFSSPSEPESSEGRFDAFSTLRSLFIVRSVVKRSPCMELSGTACGRNLLPFTAWSCSEHYAHYWGWVRMSPSTIAILSKGDGCLGVDKFH